jgi:hypothetical protein
MKKEKVGFAAFDKKSGKGLNIVFGMTNRLSLTDDPEKVYLEQDRGMAEVYTIWYNNNHKNKKEFEIKEVVEVIEIKEK